MTLNSRQSAPQPPVVTEDDSFAASEENTARQRLGSRTLHDPAALREIQEGIASGVASALFRWSRFGGRAKTDVAEELVNRILVEMFEPDGRALLGWDPQRGRTLKGWVRQHALWRSIAILRSGSLKREPLTGLGMLSDAGDNGLCETQTVECDYARKFLNHLRGQLSPEELLVLEYYYVCELSTREICNATGWSEDRVQRLRDKIRDRAAVLRKTFSVGGFVLLDHSSDGLEAMVQFCDRLLTNADREQLQSLLRANADPAAKATFPGQTAALTSGKVGRAPAPMSSGTNTNRVDWLRRSTFALAATASVAGWAAMLDTPKRSLDEAEADLDLHEGLDERDTASKEKRVSPGKRAGDTPFSLKDFLRVLQAPLRPEEPKEPSLGGSALEAELATRTGPVTIEREADAEYVRFDDTSGSLESPGSARLEFRFEVKNAHSSPIRFLVSAPQQESACLFIKRDGETNWRRWYARSSGDFQWDWLRDDARAFEYAATNERAKSASVLGIALNNAPQDLDWSPGWHVLTVASCGGPVRLDKIYIGHDDQKKLGQR